MAVFGLPSMGGWELGIILFIVLLLFGPKRLPQLGKTLGKSVKSLRDGLEGKLEEEDEEPVVKAKADAPEKTTTTAASEDEAAEE